MCNVSLNCFLGLRPYRGYHILKKRSVFSLSLYLTESAAYRNYGSIMDQLFGRRFTFLV